MFRTITKIDCQVCGFSTTDDAELEAWVDYDDGCPKCPEAEVQWTDALLHHADGRVQRIYGFSDESTTQTEMISGPNA